MTIRSETIAVTTTGSAGAATGSATSSRIVGEILGIDVNFHASAPATTDTTIQADAISGGAAARNLIVITNSATDAYVVPTVPTVDAANAARLYAAGGTAVAVNPIVNGTVTVSLAQCDALTNAAVVTIHYER